MADPQSRHARRALELTCAIIDMAFQDILTEEAAKAIHRLTTQLRGKGELAIADAIEGFAGLCIG